MLFTRLRIILALGALLSLLAVLAHVTSNPAHGSAGAVGVIAYKRGNEIRLVNSDGSGDRRLWLESLPNATYKGIRGLQWRPDGGALAFGSDFQQLCSLYDNDIYTINADGRDLKRLTNSPACGQLAGLPKGTVNVQVENQTTESQFLVYVEGAPTAQLVTVPPGTAVELAIPNVADLGNFQQYFTVINGHLRWIDPSVFVNVTAGQTASASARFVLHGQGNVYSGVGAKYPTWHRSGSKVGFLFYEGLMMQIPANPPPSGDDSFILAQGSGVIAESIVWSPVSDWILYASSEHISVVQPGANNGGTPIIDKSATELVLGLDWMPDESGFIFAITGGQFGQENSNVYAYDFTANSLTPLTNFDDDFVGGLSISPNGQKIIFEFADEPADPPQLWIMDIDGSNAQPLGIQGESPDWRPGTGIDFNHRILLPMVVEK
jgi:Tol biopolymer transport system component